VNGEPTPRADTSGTVTFLFTDIEGSTRLLQDLGDRYVGLLAQHNEILRDAFISFGGREAGNEGDGLFFIFASARGAVAAALEAQQRLAAQEWPDGATVKVRMGMHTGEIISDQHGYVGIDLHRAARIGAAAHGGQVVLSQATRELVGNDLPPGATLIELGSFQLKDLIHSQRLFQAVLPGMRTEFPPLRNVQSTPDNLPKLGSRFVGRDRELELAVAALHSIRLVTITGPGGVGKTRLAVEAAAQSRPSFPDGIWMVELATVTDPDRLLHTIASVMRLADQPGKELMDTILEYLRGHKTLVILDNCEHLLDEVARTASRLLDACPMVSVMTTSQETLGLPGEAVILVAPMTVPTGSSSVDTALSFDSIELFVERARSVVPDFTLDQRNLPAVIDICRRLDGLPLAIELAAARVKALSPAQIAERLADRFRLLTGGSRTALPRQQTLRGAIDWSFDLLSAEERLLLCRLSVFAGSFGLEAAEDITEGTGIDRIDVLDLLAGLVSRSLVVAEEIEGEQRFRLLQTIRQYAAERLAEGGDAEERRRRHRDWYLGLAERARPRLEGPDGPDWLDRLDREHDNLRAALAWSAEAAGETERGMRLAEALWRFWEIRGHLVEGRSQIERFTSRSPVDTALRANALTGVAILADHQGDYAASIRFHEESLEVHRRLGNPQAIGFALNNLANAAAKAGDRARARHLYEETVDLIRSTGDERGTAFALINMASTCDDPHEARRQFDEAIDIMRRLADAWGAAFVLDNYGVIALEDGDLGFAKEVHEEAKTIYESLGDGRGVARALTHLGDVARMAGDRAEARRLYQASLVIRNEMGDRLGLAWTLERLAPVAGHPAAAARMLGAASRIRTAIRAPLGMSEQVDWDRDLAALSEALGPEELATRMAEGSQLEIEQVMELAGSA
jgi:predicted ATPase/class 3 adenylate cyclase